MPANRELLRWLARLGATRPERKQFFRAPSSIAKFFRVNRARTGALSGAGAGLAQGVYNDEDTGDIAGRMLRYAGGGAALGAAAPRRLSKVINPAMKFGLPAAGIGLGAGALRDASNSQEAPSTPIGTPRYYN